MGVRQWCLTGLLQWGNTATIRRHTRVHYWLNNTRYTGTFLAADLERKLQEVVKESDKKGMKVRFETWSEGEYSNLCEQSRACAQTHTTSTNIQYHPCPT